MKFLPPPGETERLKVILHILRFRKCIFWRCNTGGMWRGGQYVAFGLGTGGADIVGATRHGRFFGLEVKKEGEEPTEDQKKWARDVSEMNGYVACIRSPQAAIRALQEAEDGKPSPPPGTVFD